MRISSHRWTLECLVLAGAVFALYPTGVIAYLEGLTAPWGTASLWQDGAAAAVGLLGVALVCLAISTASFWPTVIVGALGVVLWQPALHGSTDSGWATPPDPVFTAVFLGLTAIAVLASAWTGIAGWSRAPKWWPPLPSTHPADARRLALACALLAGLWIAAVRVGVFHALRLAGETHLLLWPPTAFASLAGGLVAWHTLLRPRHPQPHQPFPQAPIPTETIGGAPVGSAAAPTPRATRSVEPTPVAPALLFDVVLAESTRLELQALIKLLLRPSLGQGLGVALPQGAILHGPPGTGKTLVARAIAGETRRRMLAYSASALTSMWIGESTQLLREMFSQARAQTPCILFIDEIDGIAPDRASTGGQGGVGRRDEATRMGELLQQLEGVAGTLPGVFVIGATNRLEDVDPALRSRLGYHIELPLPDEVGRTIILRQHFPERTDVTPEDVARMTSGLSGRELRELCRVAGIIALSEDAAAVSRAHFERARQRVEPEPGAWATRRAEPTRVTPAPFSDLILPEAALRELRTLVRLVSDPEAGRALGVEPPQGALLYGPPGTGKTLIARVLAGESHRPVLAFAGASITSMWMGEGPQLVRDMFRQARSAAPCILFVDELDGITPSRETRGAAVGSTGQDATQQINQFLQELEGVGGTARGVFVVGATNHLEAIDPAVRSRLSYHVAVPLPDRAARVAMLRMLPAPAAVDPDAVAELTEGFSGRDLRELCRIAGVMALSEDAPAVTLDHMRRACERVGTTASH